MPVLVQCVACENWVALDTPLKMKEMGFAKCKQGAKWTMYGAHFTRQCDKFRQAGAEIVELREQWLQRSMK